MTLRVAKLDRFVAFAAVTASIAMAVVRGRPCIIPGWKSSAQCFFDLTPGNIPVPFSSVLNVSYERERIPQMIPCRLLRSPVLMDFADTDTVDAFTHRPTITPAYVFLRDFLTALSGAPTLAAQSTKLTRLLFSHEPYQLLALSMRQASRGTFMLLLSQFLSESPASPVALHLEFLLEPNAFGELASASVQSYRNEDSGIALSVTGSTAADVSRLVSFADSFLADLASQQFLPAAHNFAAVSRSLLRLA